MTPVFPLSFRTPPAIEYVFEAVSAARYSRSWAITSRAHAFRVTASFREIVIELPELTYVLLKLLQPANPDTLPPGVIRTVIPAFARSTRPSFVSCHV